MKKLMGSFLKELKYILILLLQIIPDRLYIKWQYYNKYHRFPNLDNPTLLSEKLQVIKLKYPSKIDIIVSNKYYLKSWLMNLNLDIKTIQTIDYTTQFNEIKWYEYPLPYIVKVTNGSNQHIICKTEKDIKSAKKIFKRIASKKHYVSKRERTYSLLEKGYIIEPFLENDGYPLDDYKVHCFNGQPLFTQINDRLSNSNRMMIDSKFNYYEYPFASGNESKIALPETKYLVKMTEISKIFSTYFDFARCDFYLHDNTVYLGEITLYPMGGYVLQKSHSIDKLWGSLLKIK